MLAPVKPRACACGEQAELARRLNEAELDIERAEKRAEKYYAEKLQLENQLAQARDTIYRLNRALQR